MNVRVAHLHNVLYQNASDLVHDITEGNNNTSPGVGGYEAVPGWDGASGLGSPDGEKLLAAIRASVQSSS